MKTQKINSGNYEMQMFGLTICAIKNDFKNNVWELWIEENSVNKLNDTISELYLSVMFQGGNKFKTKRACLNIAKNIFSTYNYIKLN